MNARSRLNAAPSRRWYVAQSHVHAESKAAMHLGRQGFEVYLPRYRKQRRHARRIDVVAAPLFPRYLFVSIDLGAQRWHSIQSTIGITRLVGNGDEPAMVSPEIIEGLRDREDAEGFVVLEQRPRFSPGDRVRIRRRGILRLPGFDMRGSAAIIGRRFCSICWAARFAWYSTVK